jgi:hypothetical protein
MPVAETRVERSLRPILNGADAPGNSRKRCIPVICAIRHPTIPRCSEELRVTGERGHHPRCSQLEISVDVCCEALPTGRNWRSRHSKLLRSPQEKDCEDWQAVETVAFSAVSSSLLKLTEEFFAVGKRSFRPWHILLRELDLRGWRLQVRANRTLKVLSHGQEESRMDAHFGW